MKTAYEQAVAALAEASGAKMEIDEDCVATMLVEERVVQLKPSDEAESGVTAFTIVAAADGGSFAPATLEAALAMNLFGAEIDKGHIGLFGDSLFLSKDLALDGVAPELLAERLLAFSRLAADVERLLGGDDGFERSASHDNFGTGGFGGFMQV